MELNCSAFKIKDSIKTNMQLSDLLLNRNLYKDPLVSDYLGVDNNYAQSQFLPDYNPYGDSGGSNATYDINTSTLGVNGATIIPGTIPPGTFDISDLGWTNTCVFSVSGASTVNWTSGVFTSASGTSYSISSGTTGSMGAKTYIYLDIGVSTTAYQTTTSVNTPIGVGKVLIAVAQNGASVATYVPVQTTQIVGDNILANTIDASKITAGSITATQISASYVYAGTISANNVTAGTLTGSIVRTSSGSSRVQMDVSSNSLSLYSSNILRAFLSGTSMTFYNASGTLTGGIYGLNSAMVLDSGSSSGNSILIQSGSAGDVIISQNGTTRFAYSNANTALTTVKLMPLADVTYDVGDSAISYRDSWFDGTQYYRQVAQPVIYFGYCSGTTISITNSSFALTNPSTGKYTLTHNFGTTNYTAVATTLRGASAGAYSIKVESYNTNSVQFTVFDDTGTVQNSDFTFLITKI